MSAAKQPPSNDDYAAAKELNTEVLSIIALVRRVDDMELPEDYEISELNRAYVLLVDELESLYGRKSELAEIKPEPLWKRFEVLDTSIGEINEYLDDSSSDMGQAHIARVNKLCIVTGNESLKLSPRQKKLIQYSSEITDKYIKILNDAGLEINAKIEDSWYIPEYRLDYKKDGTILINGVLRLKKTHIASTMDRLLEQAMKNPDKLFVPDLGRTARNLSTVLSSAGLTPTLRQLFFPVANKAKGVIFRPVVSAVQASNDGIDTVELDIQLRDLGTAITFSE